MWRLFLIGALVLAAVGCGTSTSQEVAPPAQAKGPAPPTSIQPAASVDGGATNSPASLAPTPANGEKPLAAEAPEPPTIPATVQEAEKCLDLRKLPRLKDSEPDAQQTLVHLSYDSAADVKTAFEFHKQGLADAGWKEVPQSSRFYDSDGSQSASVVFGRDSYRLSMSVISGSDALAMVDIQNHGNVNLASLPRPEGVKPFYVTPVSLGYLTEAPQAATAAKVRQLLLAQNWVPYGSAGDVTYFRQNAVQLGVRVAEGAMGPAQLGKTLIDYSSELLSAELPAPEDALELQYSEPPIQLTFDTPQSMAEVYSFYRDALAAGTWKPTTETPVRLNFHYFVIFRSDAKGLIDIKLTEVEGNTRVLVKFQTAAEVEETERAIKEKLSKPKGASDATDE